MIELKNLTKIYHTADEGAIGLKNITIKFPEIGFVALTGQSGSGKTTLLSVLSGFQPYEEGEMFIDGVDTLTFQEEDWQEYQKKDIGFIFQDYGLIESYTVIDNVIITLQIIGVKEDEIKERAVKYLKLVHLDDIASQKVVNLSLGQKQRLSIARAIAKEPKIILCDEPTANLDPENSVEIMSILGEISKKCLVITSTHNYEDAKDYANYFIRLYKGSLISYEVVNKIDNTLAELKPLNKPNPFSIYKTYAKNRKLRFGFTNLFVFMISLMLMIVLSVFLYNLDDANTKVVSQTLFNNVNNNELIVMRKDGKELDENDFSQIANIKHVTAYEKYGIATDMNYYYREDIDYRFDVTIVYVDTLMGVTEHNELELNKFNKSLYFKSYLGKIDESDLKEGNLPVGMFEVVASKQYHIGDKITVYFDNPTSIGTGEFSLEFTVSGVLKEASEDLYFSLEFASQLDFMQKVGFNNNLSLYVSYLTKRGDGKYLTIQFLPLYIGNEEEAKVYFSKSLIDSYKGNFPENVNSTILVDLSRAYLVEEQAIDEVSVTKNVSFDTPAVGEDFISGRFVLVSKDIYEFLRENYHIEYSKVYVEEYPYVNDVIGKLSSMDYFVMSPYRASSVEYDDDKVNQRSASLIISILAIVVIFLLYFFSLVFVSSMKRKEEKVMIHQGASLKLLNEVNLIELFASSLLAIILGMIAYIVIKRFNSYLFEAFKYMRVYHFIIIFALMSALTYLSSFAHNKKIAKFKTNGVINND